MGQIKDLPALERPREKAFHYGIQTLSDAELLALLIGSGTQGYGAMDIAYSIMKDKPGLTNIFDSPYQDFMKYPGLKKVTALKLVAAFELGKRYQQKNLTPENQKADTISIYQKYAPKLRGMIQECLAIVILNRRQRIIFETTLSIGSGKAVTCSSRDVLRCLILNKGNYFFLLHNHPGGTLEPSSQDVTFTGEVIRESERLGIHLIDHLIMGDSNAYSFRNDRLLLEEREA